MPIRGLLLDIEGTIIPVTFVRDVLFPYAKRHMVSFLREHSEEQVVGRWAAACLETVAQESGTRPSADRLPDILLDWIDHDRKHPGLKALQGMIWEAGYRSGDFSPALYDDVAPSLRRLHLTGWQLAVYSSGSEQAQKLLLQHTTDGDLTPLFSHFFDTGVGSKQEPGSYRRIAERMELRPENLLFLSDAEPELDAAAAAALQTLHVVRPGTNPGVRHPIRSTLADLPELAPPSAGNRSLGA